MTGMLVDRVKQEAALRVKTIAQRLATAMPGMADLSQADQERVAKAVMADSLKAELQRAVELEKIDYQKARKRFMKQADRPRADGTQSPRTLDLYNRALLRLEDFCQRQGISPLELTSALAEDWIAELQTMPGRGAPATVNVDVAAASSFWSRLEYWYSGQGLRNPFRGTRARPPKKATRKLEVPSEEEISILETSANPQLRAAIMVMSRAGLRVGALPSLVINGKGWKATTKGKEQTNVLPEAARKAITAAGLPLKGPFADLTAGKIIGRVRMLAKKLHESGQLRALYSVHDLRHAAAVRRYKETKHIYAVKTFLGHANVGVTETYLRSLGLEV